MMRFNVGLGAAAVLAIMTGSGSALADYGQDLRLAQNAVKHARKLVRKASSDCQQALAGNLDQSSSAIGSLRRSATAKTIESHQLFVAGIALAGGLSNCPKGVMADINKTAHFLTTAKERLADEGPKRRRSRRRGKKGWRGDLARALQTLEEIEEDLDDARRSCRKGVRSNLRSMERQVKGLLRAPSARKLKNSKNFMLGLSLAGPLAKCDSDINDGLSEAYRLIYRAQGTYSKGTGGGSRKGYRRYLKKASRDLSDARDGLDDAGRDCRKGLRGNMKRAIRDLDDLEDDPSSRGIKSTEQFLAGLILGGALAGCPADLIEDMRHALRMLKKARKAL